MHGSRLTALCFPVADSKVIEKSKLSLSQKARAGVDGTGPTSSIRLDQVAMEVSR